MLQAKSTADRVAASLCMKCGLKLGESQLVPKRHVDVYDPVAELLSRRFEVGDDVGKGWALTAFPREAWNLAKEEI